MKGRQIKTSYFVVYDHIENALAFLARGPGDQPCLCLSLNMKSDIDLALDALIVLTEADRTLKPEDFGKLTELFLTENFTVLKTHNAVEESTITLPRSAEAFCRN